MRQCQHTGVDECLEVKPHVLSEHVRDQPSDCLTLNFSLEVDTLDTEEDLS